MEKAALTRHGRLHESGLMEIIRKKHRNQDKRKHASRRGPMGQVDRREAERSARKSVLAFVLWTERFCGLKPLESARRLGLKATTIANWKRQWKTDRMAVKPLGRRVENVARWLRWCILAVFNLLGPGVSMAVLKSMFPEVPRAELLHLRDKYRGSYCSEHKKEFLIHALYWTQPGTVWAMDFCKPPNPIDGIYKRIFLVRDLASGMELLALPCLKEDAATVVNALLPLFRKHGAPLVIKSDNGPAFISGETALLLSCYNVLHLLSPPYTPQYNGAAEAGVGHLETRAHFQSARFGRPGEWTCDDVWTAVNQMNETSRPLGVHGPTPKVFWDARDPIQDHMRDELRRTYLHFVEQEFSANGVAPGTTPDKRVAESIDRIAITRALVEHGLLFFRRRRITPRFNRRKVPNIS